MSEKLKPLPKNRDPNEIYDEKAGGRDLDEILWSEAEWMERALKAESKCYDLRIQLESAKNAAASADLKLSRLESASKQLLDSGGQKVDRSTYPSDAGKDSSGLPSQ